MKLYTYYRSSAAYRTRIALNLKGLAFDSVPVHLVRDGGEQHSEAHLARNPQGLVPVLEHEQNMLSQSLAIIEYLDEEYPEPSLLPGNAAQRASIRSIAQSIACDIHPLNNLRVLQYLSQELSVTDQQKSEWYVHWVEKGFAALEQTLKRSSLDGQFCLAGQATLADCCLIPQVYNAQRFNVDMTAYPTLSSINDHCLSLSAFSEAAPEQQADAST